MIRPPRDVARTFTVASTMTALFAGIWACTGDEPVLPPSTSNDGGSDGAVVPVLPSAPTDVTAVADVVRGATIAWKLPAQGAPFTKITVRAIPFDRRVDVASDSTRATMRELTAGTSYTFTVRASNAAGDGPESAPSNAVTVLDAPPVPAKVTVCAGNGEALYFVGSAVGATGVNVYVSTTMGGAKPGTGAAKVAGKGAGRVTLPSLVNGTTYYVAATANLGDVESAPSQELRVTPKSFTAVGDVLFASRFDNSSVDMWDGYIGLPNGAAPTRSLVGGTVGLDRPPYGGLAAWKATGQLFVSSSSPSLAMFDDAAALSGDVAPSRLLLGASTKLATPRGIAVDTSRNLLYVANRSGSILRFENACGATGDFAPSGTIAGSSTKLGSDVAQIAIDEATDRLFVANYADVLVFDAASTKDGDVAPTKQFVMGTPVTGKTGVGYDTINDTLYVASLDEAQGPNTGGVFAIDKPSTVASGVVTPTRLAVIPETQKAATLRLSNGRLFLLGDSARLVSRWDDAKAIASSAPVRTANGAAGTFYTGVFYVP